MNLNLEGKIALVTGGSRGIGLAIKQELEKEGVKVYSASRTEGYDLLKDINLLIKNIASVDILINNVGGGGRWGSDILTFEEWDKVYEKNAGIMRKLTINYLPAMIKKEWGRIITISSVYSKEKGAYPWFSMAKASENAFMSAMSGRYPGITFNAVLPGNINAGANNSKNYGSPEDVAGIVAFLCSDRAKWINGAAITVDNGQSKSF